jgi:tRNA G18 (ribose-2'-O)-methylase SpoU
MYFYPILKQKTRRNTFVIIQSEIITSRQNPAIKWAASLQTKKGREENKCFLADGEKLAREAARSRLPVSHIFISEKRRAQLVGYVIRKT